VSWKRIEIFVRGVGAPSTIRIMNSRRAILERRRVSAAAAADRASKNPPDRRFRPWSNGSKTEKGFGFVELSDGSGDAFLHASVLGRLGVTAVQPGETLEVRVAQGQRRAAGDLRCSMSTPAPRPRRGRAPGSGPPSERRSKRRPSENGTVKWYNSTKGFGFIVRDGGGKDVIRARLGLAAGGPYLARRRAARRRRHCRGLQGAGSHRDPPRLAGRRLLPPLDCRHQAGYAASRRRQQRTFRHPLRQPTRRRGDRN